MASAGGDGGGEVHHEKQRWLLCGLHACNALLSASGRAKAALLTQKDLDNVCYSLAPGALINPHKSSECRLVVECRSPDLHCVRREHKRRAEASF